VSTASHWDDVAARADRGRDWLWRRHADEVNAVLCRRWIRGSVRHLLKTDAFDEAVGGGLAPALQGVADRVSLIDLSGSMAARALRRAPSVSVSVADVRALPFADGSFDVVVSNSTLDHFERESAIADALRELRRVLAVGGRLIVTLDNPEHPLVWMRNSLPFSWVHRVGLVPYFVGATLGHGRLREVLEATGFDVLDATAVLHCPRVLAIPLARVTADPRVPQRMQAALLRALTSCERAERWPTRFVTGHFVAALAVRCS
jgi:SAM-dependent methyltransferase